MEEGGLGRQSFPSIRALGSLFKLTKVYIWDDGSTEKIDVSLFPQSIESPPKNDDTSSESPALTTTDFGPSTEDDELSKQMDALGLPLAFQSNKKTMNHTKKGKRKGAVMKHSRDHDTTAIASLEVSKWTPAILKIYVLKIMSPTKVPPESIFLDQCGECEMGQTVSGTDHMTNDEYEKDNTILDNSDAANPDIADGLKEVVNLMEMDCIHGYPVVNDLQECENRMEWPEASEAAMLQRSEVLGDNGIESHDQNGAFGDWVVYWDSFYKRNYFYNAKTNSSTWSPPPGTEHLAFSSLTNEAYEVITGDYEIGDDPSVSCGLLKCSGLFEEPANDSRIADQPSNEVCVGDELASEGTLPSLTFSTVNGCLENDGAQKGTDKGCLGDISQQTALEELGHIDSVISD
ncbi:unnamed protein product [Linum tenue]|uniref:WW domain-containing protein n=1 Tax=Linum tenue TaxID=586396 RepID=A0AAV0P470_9ROSI|nr:unnamed protein product [Linum tenue]